MTAIAKETLMTIRQAARDQSVAAAVMAEAAEIWELLAGPDGRPMTTTAPAYVEGIAPAAACYLLPLWARSKAGPECRCGGYGPTAAGAPAHPAATSCSWLPRSAWLPSNTTPRPGPVGR